MVTQGHSGTSTTITFPGPRQIEFVEASVPAPASGQIVVETLASLISTGTELTAYSGDFPRGDSAWARYVRYPFPAGYSNVGRVVDAGANVAAFRPGDRVVSGAPHATHACVDAASAMRVPESTTDEEATFWALGCTV